MEERLALWELYVWAAGIIFLIWIFVQVAKDPNRGIPVTVVETKTEEAPASEDEPESFPEDDWATVTREIRESNALIAKAVERQNRILERIESRRER